MHYSHFNNMETPRTKRFIPKEFELGTTLSKPNGSIGGCHGNSDLENS